MDGTGDPKRFRSTRLANGEGTDFPGEWHEQRPEVGKACDFLKELKAFYSFTPLFIYPPICAGPCVLGMGPLRGDGSGLA